MNRHLDGDFASFSSWNSAPSPGFLLALTSRTALFKHPDPLSYFIDDSVPAKPEAKRGGKELHGSFGPTASRSDIALEEAVISNG